MTEKIDLVMNAVSIGMLPEDAYVYAGLTPMEIDALDKNDDFQRKLSQHAKVTEYQLLRQMKDISEKQVRMGKEAATAWLLEKLYPRYSSKAQEGTVPVTINLGQKDPVTLDTVSIVQPSDASNGMTTQ